MNLNIYIVVRRDPADGLKVFMETIGELKDQPLIAVSKVWKDL